VPNERLSGILLHPTSLPGPYGIGDLGPPAYRFADFLAETGQSLWQVLPLGPTGYGNSPYMSFSAFGGNPLLISPELLAEEGLLRPEELETSPDDRTDRVRFEQVIDAKLRMLGKAYRRFSLHEAALPAEYSAFRELHAFWLEDYALFMALKEAYGGRVWSEWEESAMRRDPAALLRRRNELAERVRFHEFVQYVFFKQWSSLKEYCHGKGIRIVGDIPIYVAYDSSEVWANRELFHLDGKGKPLVVAGVPPDYFSATGQRWGNPIYRWDVMAERGFSWWIERFRMNFVLADILRLDHFRGFEAYWEIPAGEPTAENGRWVKGPGDELFNAARSALMNPGVGFDVIAEDLGVITPEVDALRDRLGFPGMRILQMAFGSDPKASDYRPHNFIPGCVVYTATHDHNTTVGWFTAEPGTQTTQSAGEIARERSFAARYANGDGSEIHWDFLRLALASTAGMAIFPLQDLLGLGTESRMNRPGSTGGNWEWRFREGDTSPAIRRRLAEMVRLYDRDPRTNPTPPARGTEA
jgi:4-alpha-glucanotransferase